MSRIDYLLIIYYVNAKKINNALYLCDIASSGVITPNQIPLTTIVTYLQKGDRSRISNHWATMTACNVVPPIYKQSKKTYCHISF